MNEIVEKYQRQFARYFGAKWAFAFWKGRIGLYALLRALDIGVGDEVVLPGYTCVMNVNPIKYVGAKPVYVDIEPETFNMNVALLEQKLTDKTKVIIAQHTYGYPCDMDAIMSIAGGSDIAVIEDCCLALGSRYKRKLVGTFGLAAYFSFQWNKPYTTGLGGMVITSDADLAGRIESLRTDEMCKPSLREVLMLRAQLMVYRLLVYPRTTAWAQRLFRYLVRKGALVGSSSAGEFEPVKAVDFFKGLSAAQARSGLRQLRKIDHNIAHRLSMALRYDVLLKGKGLESRSYDGGVMRPVMVRYPVRVAEKTEALEQAATAGIELGSWFECPLHPIETPLASYDYEIGMCPEAEKAAREVVNLPLHQRTHEEILRQSVDFIARFATGSN
ncbi:MAG: DegT/DnrJ/EryC1/StrS family aminotransferase [Phycisphaerales bacterium]|nr:MAG: DegT/DnrJ/EryC1/StrS family aminotransferase [Phycisphaerales bacterium]UCF14628.1 MAG: DegT/DnrJ/EryC1/StrS family aminotransferase [Phycisphaerales bacterium]